jgi:DnaJ-class molecular chaperone
MRPDCKMARQLIDAGYRALALKHHPDKGGSKEAMARLVVIRNQMRKDWK